MRRHIMVVGVPSSGNRLLRYLLEHSGARVTISHGPSAISTEVTAGKAEGAVVIVRSQPFWDASINKTPRRRKAIAAGQGHNPDASLEGYILAGICGSLLTHGLPFVVITYEALISETEKVMRYVYDAFGLEFPTPFKPLLYDANKTPEAEKPDQNPGGGVFR